MKKILFIRTKESNEVYLSSPTITPPLGLLYLASSIRKKFPNTYDIKIIDMRISRISIEAIAFEIRNFNPDIIGCSVLSCEYECMNGIADSSKIINRDSKFIVGGPHPSMYYDDVLRNNNIDIAVIGEGEETICDLLYNFEHNGEIDKVQGIAFKKDSQIVQTENRVPIQDLDSIPFPAWDLIPLHRYSCFNRLSFNGLLAGRRYAALFTSRGCPYQCVYCHNIFGKTCRNRSAENVFKEIVELHNTYHVDEFQIVDDIFNFDKERTERICDLIISSGIKIWLAFPNGLRIDILDEELLERLKSAGTYSIAFALETASPRIQTAIGKNVNINKLNSMIKVADSKGIFTNGFFMMGFPGETIEDIDKTIDFACKSMLCEATFFIVTPQKNTKLYELIKKEFPGFKLDLDLNHYFRANRSYQQEIIKLPLEKLRRRAKIRFYGNPQRLMRIWSRTKRKIFLFILLYMAIRRFFKSKIL